MSGFSRQKILEAVAGAGFEVEEARRFGRCLPFGDKLLGRFNFRLEAAHGEHLRYRGGEALFKLRKPA